MRHKIPKISEVNLELIDVEFYFENPIRAEDIGINISVKASFSKDNKIIFFIHLRYLLVSPEIERDSLFHTDYLSFIEVEEVNWGQSETVEIEQAELAHLLGMSLLMVRGSVANRLSSNSLSSYSLPIFRPLDLLKKSLEEKGNSFVLTNELIGHKASDKGSKS